MAETLLTIIGISVILAIPAGSLLLGLQEEKPYLKKLYQNKSMLIRNILTMFIIAPFVAYLFYLLLPEYQFIWVALIVISICPVQPGLIKKITKLSGDDKLSIAWMITALFLSLIFLPLNLFIMQKVFHVDIVFGMDDVILKYLMLFIIPMLVGFMLSSYLKSHVPKIIKIVSLISKIAMLILVICLMILAVPIIISKGITPVIMISLYLVVMLLTAHLIGLPDKRYGAILPYSVILRLPAAPIALAKLNGTMDKHLSTIITYLILGILLMMIYDKVFYRKVK
ncbi:MAG TPA: hypothetical protein PKC91_10085 [Ignavibacteria bacterium]|nr:hypothetical protein [Ignavibacteria bacterium]